MQPFNVTIIKAQPSMWYNSEIGKIKTVINTSSTYYQLVDEKNPQTQKIIFKCDAVVNK